jgi:hypothetical protein
MFSIEPLALPPGFENQNAMFRIPISRNNVYPARTIYRDKKRTIQKMVLGLQGLTWGLIPYKVVAGFIPLRAVN